MLFARYAYPPNQLGYCGPPDSDDVLSVATGQELAVDFAARARGFDGAWTYLGIIAAAAGITDPLDPRVVEAYWVGNELLEQVDPLHFAATVRQRFAGEFGAHWAALEPGGPHPSVPHHGFQVFTVYPWVGLLGRGGTAVTVLDQCRIRWGQVRAIDGDHLEIACRPLTWQGGQLGLGSAGTQRIRWAQDGRSLLQRPVVGTWVAAHWDWACDELSDDRLDQLVRRTDNQLAATNHALAAAQPNLAR